MEITHGFFEGRLALNLKRLSNDGPAKKFAEYLNISPVIATIQSHRMATLYELDTVYGVKDVYDMLEIITIDGHNNALANQG